MRFFYLVLSCVLTVGIVVGFWPTYFGPLLEGTLNIRPMVEVHAIVFLGWMVLLIIQAALAYFRRVDLHQKLGVFGVVYGALIVIVGFLVMFDSFFAQIEAGEVRQAHINLLIPLVDLILFAIFFGSAIIYRRKSSTHKRLIILASIVLFGPAVGRMTFLTSIPQLALITFGPILLGMCYDLINRRRIHPVYVIGLIVFLASIARVPLRDSETWINFTMRISGWFI